MYINLLIFMFYYINTGVGLGLTICKLLVKQLGPLKQIFVDS